MTTLKSVNLKRNEYAGIDYFRVVAAILVVAIHTSPLMGLNETADFILTRVIARVAVPFFFITSGFFLFHLQKGSYQQNTKLLAFIKKTAIIYGITAILYLPLNAYTGTLKEWMHASIFIKDILFDGTFYHMWYLPASIIGACITWLLLKKLRIGQAFFVGILLYIIGLFGDSYYGISENIPFLKSMYQALFFFSDYTRNGLFFAPVFFLLGALLAIHKKRMPLKACLIGLAVSITIMVMEGLLLHRFNLQKHDSMYLMLLPCMFFLFQGLLLWKGKRVKYLRDLSLLIYLIHPGVIVAVRGLAKVMGLQELFINNSIIHFIAVVFASLASSSILVVLINGRPTRRADFPAGMDRAWAEINMENLSHNVTELGKLLPKGCRIMAVVKANAYGHGAVQISVCLNRIGINAFAVATVDEGIRLRKSGVKGEILILGYTSSVRAFDLFYYRLTQTVTDIDHAEELNRIGKPIQVHIKVNTGMNRLGESYKHVSEIASIFSCRNLNITGIFTHLCVSDSLNKSDIDFTNMQIKNFYELLDKLKKRHIEIPPVHIQSSYGVLNYPQLQCDYARIGIALYGVLSTLGKNTKTPVNLRPVLSLKSKVSVIRIIAAGQSVGYRRRFIAREETKIAIVSIGYADGLPRSLSAKGHVLVNGCRVPIIGSICMDQLIVDVTDVAGIKKGDIVTLIGKDGSEEITAEQVAFEAETITNELLSRLSDSRLKRIFLDF